MLELVEDIVLCDFNAWSSVVALVVSLFYRSQVHPMTPDVVATA